MSTLSHPSDYTERNSSSLSCQAEFESTAILNLTSTLGYIVPPTVQTTRPYVVEGPLLPHALQ